VGPVGDQKSSQSERKSGTGAVTSCAAGKREGGERLDSIKPKPAGELFGTLHFSSEFLGDFFPPFTV